MTAYPRAGVQSGCVEGLRFSGGLGGAVEGREIDFDDAATANPELLQPLPLQPKDNVM